VKRRISKAIDHYSPARRLHQLKTMLNSSGGVTMYEIAERLGVSVRTAIRYMRALEKAEEPVYADADGRKKVYRLRPNAKYETLTLNAGQMLALFVCRRTFDFLDGTGLKEDLDDVFAQLEATLRRKDFGKVRNLDRKVFDVNEAPHIYEGRIEDMNAITTALLRDERLRIRHASVGEGGSRFVVDPYTLLIYKKGVYLVGYSHHHEAIRTFALDGIRAAVWLKGDRFEYPADYDPARLTEGAFGLVSGERCRVRIRFDKSVARYLRRRRWHPTQKLAATHDGIELVMDVASSFEVDNWILSFGDKATVIEPADLRERIAAQLQRAAARYAALNT
jgi:proteasome accessory factor B